MSTATKLMIGATAVAATVIAGIALKGKSFKNNPLENLCIPEQVAQYLKENPNYKIKRFKKSGKTTITVHKETKGSTYLDKEKMIYVFDKDGNYTRRISLGTSSFIDTPNEVVSRGHQVYDADGRILKLHSWTRDTKEPGKITISTDWYDYNEHGIQNTVKKRRSSITEEELENGWIEKTISHRGLIQEGVLGSLQYTNNTTGEKFVLTKFASQDSKHPTRMFKFNHGEWKEQSALSEDELKLYNRVVRGIEE